MAKRMILVDERMFKELWERSPTHTSKSDLNNQLQSELDNSQIPDDVKAKHYQNALSRFLNLRQQVPSTQPTALNGQTVTRKVQKVPKKAASISNPWARIATRSTKRKHIPWTRYE
jgi:hypothetical protein